MQLGEEFAVKKLGLAPRAAGIRVALLFWFRALASSAAAIAEAAGRAEVEGYRRPFGELVAARGARVG